MGTERKPHVLCEVCTQLMDSPDMPVGKVAISLPSEALAVGHPSNTENVLRCLNPRCVAPRRAVIFPRKYEARIVPQLKSWTPITTFRLRYVDSPDAFDDQYAVAQFALDEIRRTPDISFSASIDLEELRRTLDGFGRELRGALTVLDFYCWGDHTESANWHLQPIEAFSSDAGPVPPRYNPFCAKLREFIHRAAVREVSSILQSNDCPFAALQHDTVTDAQAARRPVCVKCFARPALAASSESSSNMSWSTCHLYTSLLPQLSPCYQSDNARFAELLSLCRERGVRTATALWSDRVVFHMHTCWAGFTEVSFPILVHNHLVGLVITGQMVLLTGADTPRERAAALATVASVAPRVLMERFPICDTEQVSELAGTLDVRLWEEQESKEECSWFATPDLIEPKIRTLRSSADILERSAQERYAKERRLREEAFQDELFGRLEAARELSATEVRTVIPQLLCRMRDFWAFEEVYYLNASPRTSGELSLVASSDGPVTPSNEEVQVPPIEFVGRVPRSGFLLSTTGPIDAEPNAMCEILPTLRALQAQLGWSDRAAMVVHTIPTTYGQDVFWLHGRDASQCSYKPRLEPPSGLCLESVRRICTGLSKRIADSTYFAEQVHNLHLLGHSLKPAIETAHTALKNLAVGSGLAQDSSYRNLQSALADVSERANLAIEIVRLQQEKEPPASVLVDLLERARRAAKLGKTRHGIQWDLHAGGASSYELWVPERYLRLLVSNSIGNAFKYSFKTRTVTITIKEDPTVPDTVFTVSNWGYGVLEDERPLLTKLLYRGIKVRHLPGTGLGMYLIETIMKKLGRYWSFTSEPSGEYVDKVKGTSFVNTLELRLPRRA